MNVYHSLAQRGPSTLPRFSIPLAVFFSVALFTVYLQARDPYQQPSSLALEDGGGLATLWEEGEGGLEPPPLSPKELYKQAWEVLDKNREPEPPMEGTTLDNYTFVPPHNVCAFVSDNRPVRTPDDMRLFDPSLTRDALSFLREHSLSMTYWNNLAWALRHGYRFSRHNPEPYPDRHAMWSKLKGILEAKEDSSCQYLVYMDSDVYVRQANYTFNDMRLRWGMHDGAIMLISKDIRMNDGGYNTGLIIMKNGPELRELLDDWSTCPDKIAGCEKYKKQHPADQGAFVGFIMPRMVINETLIIAPCNEANGNTGMANDPANPTHCSGTIVTHNWWKAKLNGALETVQMMAYQNALLMEALQHL